MKLLKLITFLLTCSFVINCSSDDKPKTFSPPSIMQDVWISPVEPIFTKLQFTEHNLIEEIVFYEMVNGGYLDFEKEFSNGEYDISETISRYSYEIVIKRKDGERIYNQPELRRKYVLGVYKNREVLFLDQQGMAGAFLVRQ